MKLTDFLPQTSLNDEQEKKSGLSLDRLFLFVFFLWVFLITSETTWLILLRNYSIRTYGIRPQSSVRSSPATSMLQRTFASKSNWMRSSNGPYWLSLWKRWRKESFWTLELFDSRSVPRKDRFRDIIHITAYSAIEVVVASRKRLYQWEGPWPLLG